MNRNTYICVLFRNNFDLVAPFFYFLEKSFEHSVRYPVIALDNGSTDSTGIEIISRAGSDTTARRVENNLGISKGRNKLIQIAKEKNGGEFPNIVFLDSDVFISRQGAIRTLHETLVQKKAGVVCGETSSFRPGPDGVKFYTDYGVAFCIISGDTFKKIGLFDERFELYYDDSDFFNRAVIAGKIKFHCSEAKAIHIWGETLTTGSEGERRESCIQADKKRYWNKMKGK
jgi:GT2 family glycosyltransferase